MSTAPLPQPIKLPRQATGALVQALGLPLGALGAPVVDFCPDTAYNQSIVQWWNGTNPSQRISREALAAMAAPVVLADIRVMFQRSTQLRTWALTGSVAPSAWLLLAHQEASDQYEIQPIPDRQTLVNTLFTYLESGVPVWEAELRVTMSAAEFALLLALADFHSRAEYASLVVHSPAPAAWSAQDIQQAWQNGLQAPDPRYLLPFACELFPEGVESLTPADLQGLTERLVSAGVLQRQGAQVAWSEPGRFLAESLHRRVCAMTIDLVGAGNNGAVGSQGALFVRSDQPLWYCDVDRVPNGQAVIAGVSAEMARSLLDEIFKPVGVPPSQAEIDARKAALAAPPPVYGAPPMPGYAPPQQPGWGGQPQGYQPPPPVPGQMPAGRFCGSCGSRVEAGARFCPGCGAQA